MAKYLTFLILLSILSCGKKAEVSDGLISTGAFPPDSDLQAYADSFKAKMDLAGVTSNRWSTLTMNFKDLPQNIAGVCVVGSSGYTIHIGRYWMLMDDAKKEQLMYHELGHCILNRAHNDGKTTNNMPESVMHSFLFSGSIYSGSYVRYMAELFGVAETVFAGYAFDSATYPMSAEPYMAPEELHTLCGNEH